jgi:hypothetical protein
MNDAPKIIARTGKRKYPIPNRKEKILYKKAPPSPAPWKAARMRIRATTNQITP